jgi:hypothetical protein
MGNINYCPPAREDTDGLCPACLSENVGYDVVSYLSGVSAPDGGVERLTEEQSVCYDCGERATIATRGGLQYTPETLMEALNQLRTPEGSGPK